MANKKQSNGVQATIERLTGFVPCPEYLRNTLYKYLYDPRLFEGASNKHGNRCRGKLEAGVTDNLVRNILDLDTIFRGDTTFVTNIILHELEAGELGEKVDAAQREIEQRLDAYAYWAQRMESLKQTLTGGKANLRADCLDEKLEAASGSTRTTLPGRFGLRAVQELERIETRGRPGRLTAKELTEQADAYLALSDLTRAAEKARAALEVDTTFPRAWVIRVMVALRLRNTAIREKRHQELVASEIAEPMSSQERMARELADEEAERASRQNEKLDEILPQAILHWPKTNGWQYDQADQRTTVRDIFIDQIFFRATHGRHDTNHAFLQETNGFGPEDAFDRREWLSMPGNGFSYGESRLPLSEADQSALTLIIAEKDKYPVTFFEPGDSEQTLRDLKLLHLRWLFKLDGYERHWSSFAECIEGHPDLYLTRILGNQLVVRIWHMHQCINSGFETVMRTLDLWRANIVDRVESDCRNTLLDHFCHLFHYQFVRGQFQNCIVVARKGQSVAGLALTRTGHPTDDCTTVPAGAPLYWRYLEALSVIGMTTTTEPPSSSGIELLLNAESVSHEFRDIEACFWVEGGELVEGCAEDFKRPPYDVDLRDTEPWMKALEAILAAADTPHAHELKATLARLGAQCRPFAPKPPVFPHLPTPMED